MDGSGGEGFRYFFFSSRRRHTRFDCDWSSDVCSSDLLVHGAFADGSSWRKVISVLEKNGRTVTALQIPLKSLTDDRSEEHTSELQSQSNLVCRLLLEKKKKHQRHKITSTRLARLFMLS